MNTLEKVNIAILLATITYIIAINSLLSGTERIGPGLRWFITFLTSVGLFRLLIVLVYWLIQIAKALGAHVTALTSPGNADFVRGLGVEGAPCWRGIVFC
jgi:hypothetical protein